MRIAVVGGGISGMTAALALAPHADVTIFEKDFRLGGHANTHTVRVNGKDVTVDTGFMVFNPPRYPVFMALLRYLDIDSVPTSMSFSVSIPGQVEFSSVVPSGLFAQPFNVFSPRYIAFLAEIARFNHIARKALSTGIPLDTTLGDFIVTHGFSTRLQQWYLFPILAAIWSCSMYKVEAFPALATFRFLDNHCLLNLSQKTAWRTIAGGSARYVRAVETKLDEHGANIIRNARISAISRTSDSITLVENDVEMLFDHVVLATHADEALALLEDASEMERDILGSFSYSENSTILHSDKSLMPSRRAAWACWNYVAPEEKGGALSVTYDMNALQHISPETPMYVSLNPTRPIHEDLVHARMTYSHPRFDIKTLKAQERLDEIQGKNRTLFAGAHWGYGFHEDGAASGLNAAAALGITPSWNK